MILEPKWSNIFTMSYTWKLKASSAHIMGMDITVMKETSYFQLFFLAVRWGLKGIFMDAN